MNQSKQREYFRTDLGKLGIKDTEITSGNNYTAPYFTGRMIEYDKKTKMWRWGRREPIFLRVKSRIYFFKRVPKRYLLQIIQANLHEL